MKAISLVFTQFYPEHLVETRLESFKTETQSKDYTVTNPFTIELRMKGYSFRIEVISLNDKYRTMVTLEEVLF